LKAIYIDGALVSYGLTSQAEVDVAMAALARLRHVATTAKNEFARLYPGLVDDVDFLGPASKMWSTSESYAFGLAFFFKTHIATKFAGRPYIAIPRVYGSCFMYQLIAASSFVFMHEQMQSCLCTQIFRASHSKIASTMWAQLSSPHIYLEARVLEGMFAMLFEQLQVMLGSPHSHYSGASGGGSSKADGAGGGESDDAAGAGGADNGATVFEEAAKAAVGAGGEQGVGAHGAFVSFWRANGGKEGACPALSAYKSSVDLPKRIELAELTAADSKIAALLAAELPAGAASADAAVCLMIDGGTDTTPATESCCIFFHIEIFKCAIKMLAEVKRDPSILFRDERPSVKLAPFFRRWP
jgi:hypothetical protein